MRNRHALVVAVVLALASCADAATERPPRATTLAPGGELIAGTYAPPTPNARVLPIASFAEPPARVFTRFTRHVRNLAFEMTVERPADLLMVIRYSGGPAGFIDCGESRSGDEATALATDAAVLAARPSSGGEWVEQRFRLDARQVLIVEANGGGAIAGVSGTYIVQRTERLLDDAGDVIGERASRVDFVSGSAARFPDGVSCAATGVMEAVILALGELD